MGVLLQLIEVNGTEHAQIVLKTFLGEHLKIYLYYFKLNACVCL